MPARTGTRGDGCEDRGAERGGLGRAGEEHGPPQHIGGATVMSRVDVPMIFTSVPGATPAPTAP